jgi:hypothetical protein
MRCGGGCAGRGGRIRAWWREERGEGVISTAIAVLIMAFLGAAMWVVFDRVFEQAAQNVETEVSRIGGAG